MTIPVGRPHEVAEKVARVRSLLDRLKLKGVLLRRASNVAWLSGGRHVFVGLSNPDGVAYALVTADRLYLLTNRIEAARMADEEHLSAAGFEIVVANWYEAMPSASDLAGGPVGVDGSYPDGQNILDHIIALRAPLTNDEIVRYRWLGQTTGDILQKVAKGIAPGITEDQIAGRLSGALVSQGLTMTVLLVATDERIFRFRHPLPTAKRLDRYAMLVVATRRWGLHVSATRLVYFGKMPDELRRRAEACARVDATFITATRPGLSVGEVFRRGMEAYAAAGYPDEWQLHHQGGPCGYEGRDYRATPSSTAIVTRNQAFAWNPSITGTKSEDTVLVSDDGHEVLTAAEDWPSWTFVLNNQACSRPMVLELP